MASQSIGLMNRALKKAEMASASWCSVLLNQTPVAGVLHKTKFTPDRLDAHRA